MNRLLLTALFILAACGINAQDAPVLQCVAQQANGDVLLTWENNHACAGDFVATHIFSADALAGVYTEIDLVVDGTETTTIVPQPTGATQFYYLTHECTTGTSVSSDTLDLSDAEPPQITNVTVLGGQTLISWEPSPSPETFGYYLYNFNSGAFQLIDSILVSDSSIDPSNPLYQDILSTPELGPEEYDISTFDFCRVGGVFSAEPHKTIHLTYEFDSCTNNIKILWTAYQGWETSEHRLYKVGDPTPIAVLGPNEFNYTYDLAPTDGGVIAFSLVAESVGGLNTSRSNEVEVDVQLASLPSYLFLKNLTVINENQIQLRWALDESGFFDKSLVFRGTDSLDMGEIIDLGPTEIPVQTAYVDSDVLTDRAPWYYRLALENSCGLQRRSLLGRTIFLEGEDNLDLTNGLNWNAFEMANATVNEYRLFRLDGDLETELATLSPNEPLEYVDDVSGIQPESGEYCYRVQASFDCNAPGLPTETNTTASNQFCISQTSRIYVPNAFSPEGINNEFKPVVVYPNYNDYKMTVLNRWGEKIFESTNPDFGWDGRIRGDLAPQGVYAYVIEMLSFNGFQLQRKGTVLLTR